MWGRRLKDLLYYRCVPDASNFQTLSIIYSPRCRFRLVVCAQLQKMSNFRNFVRFQKIQNLNAFKDILGNTFDTIAPFRPPRWVNGKYRLLQIHPPPPLHTAHPFPGLPSLQIFKHSSRHIWLFIHICSSHYLSHYYLFIKPRRARLRLNLPNQMELDTMLEKSILVTHIWNFRRCAQNGCNTHVGMLPLFWKYVCLSKHNFLLNCRLH